MALDEAALRSFVLPNMNLKDSSHNMEHVDFVVEWVKKIIPSRSYRIGVAAAYLHDINDTKYELAVKREDIFEVLTSIGLTEEEATSSLNVSQSISFSRRLHQGVPILTPLEMESYFAISDADMLDAMGVIGLIRTCVFHSHHRNRNSLKGAIDYVHKVLVKCNDFMHYSQSIEESKVRLIRMNSFLKDIQAERGRSFWTMQFEEQGESKA
jgi:hypothetical protein